MSVSENAAALRGQADITMALAAIEQVKNELFECEGMCAQLLGQHPGMQDIAGSIGTARENAEALTQSLHLLSGTITGVADTLMRGGS
jgi:hypothetical protein